MLITRAEIEGRAPLDVRIDAGRVARIAPQLAPAPGEPVLDAAGGALLPGLHDHHLHLFALAAALRSVRCGPPEVSDRDALASALRAAPAADGWVRGVGYHESVAGRLDRDALDALAPGRAVRLQHRSGALWMLSSAAIERLGLEARAEVPGVERDARGRATGRLFHADAWLRARLAPDAPPPLDAVGRALARCGVTGVTDATPTNDADALRALGDAVLRGALPQRVVVMGRLELPASSHPGVERGALKLVLREDAPADFDALRAAIADAHSRSRAVAVHCVTRAELVLAAAAFAAAGCRPGDRIEHASVAPPDAVELLRALPLTVVTQPNFVAERGDAYAVDVDPDERPWLYRCRGFVDAGVPLGAGTDAPFGDPDPWRAMRAAVDRRTPGGRVLGAGEALSPERALALFTTPADAPGSAPRRVAPGSPADLCLLDRPWRAAREQLSRACVAATLRDGRVVHDAARAGGALSGAADPGRAARRCCAGSPRSRPRSYC